MQKILKYTVISIVVLFILTFVIQLIIGLSYRGYLYPYGYGNAPYGMSPWMMGSGGGFSWLGGGLFLIFLIVIIFALLGESGITKSSEKPVISAIELLNKRYASGEITREEYLEKKRDLE
ncbi:MAG: SHOCT domain-containing protein [Methanocellales archaeon]